MDPENFEEHLLPSKAERDRSKNSRKLAQLVQRWKERLAAACTTEEVDALDKEVSNKLSGIMQSDKYSSNGVQAVCTSWGNAVKWKREDLTKAKGGKSW